MLDVARLAAPALAEAWRSARPFPHVVIDDFVEPAALVTLQQAVAAEPHWQNRGEIYDMMACGDTVTHPTLESLRVELGSQEALAALGTLAGRPLTRVDMRSYVYVAGSYLLPHTDCQAAIGRVIAYAYYLWVECKGGELELFECTTRDDGKLATTEPAGMIAPRSNRIVLFEVTPTSLHQVREVLEGARVSLAGWFYG